MIRILPQGLCVLLFLCGFLPWVSCAGKDGAEEKEYGEIVNSGLRGGELISALEDFEIRHGGHFDSKLDLGIYYLAAGETDRAREYLRRAERIFLDGAGRPVSSGKEGYAGLMYGALAQVCLVRGEYQEALDYIDRAIGEKGGNKTSFHFLKGHILITGHEYGAALEIFDGLIGAGGAAVGSNTVVNSYAAAGSGTTTGGNTVTDSVAALDGGNDGAGEEELRAYMFLLAQAERPVEAAAVLDRYLLTGAFFPGLGYFGAALYRTAGDMEKAAWAAYLEEEYRSGYGELQNSQSGGFESLMGEISLPGAGGTEAGRPGGGKIETGGGHFAAEYIRLKNLISGGNSAEGNFTKDEFLRLTGLEPYFRLFPSFYWQLWLGARLAYPDDYRYFSAALQKIIVLDKDGPFARKAWEELTRLMGY
ncbi:MAG: hypothetical protein LBB77_07150 [Treponema sp.]|jgi:tetratricopeptide (TPR) repeat protein|nr:hypothetical protein [Treponema sp.]